VTSFANYGSLQSVLRSGALSLPIARYIFRSAAAGLSHLHSLKIAHQDVKPGNILLSKNGGVFLSDFGLSHRFDESLVVFGTLYQAPEVLDVRPGASAIWAGKQDVWLLGFTLYEMLFGATPFKGETVYEIIAAINETDLARPDGADEEAWEAIAGMLKIDPAQRWTMQEVMQSPFVAGAPEKVEFGQFREVEVRRENPDWPVVEMCGSACTPEECSDRLFAGEECLWRRCLSFP
jgi:serine/threonine protein kinase